MNPDEGTLNHGAEGRQAAKKVELEKTSTKSLAAQPANVSVNGAPRSVVDRVAAILDGFSAQRPAMRLNDIVEYSRLPKSTVHRLAEAMVARGWLDRSDSVYTIGIRMFEFGGLVDHRWSLREAAIPFMEDLYEATHEVVHLGVLIGDEVLYVDKIGGHRSMNVPSRVGGRMPAHATGLGKALLASSPPAVIRQIVSRPLQRVSSRTIVVPAVLLEELSATAKRGYAIDREEIGHGMSCVAAPVIVQGQLFGAISVTGPSRRIDPERLAPAVRTASLGIARVIGLENNRQEAG